MFVCVRVSICMCVRVSVFQRISECTGTYMYVRLCLHFCVYKNRYNFIIILILFFVVSLY